jgi:nicotinamidase-related amidase
LHETLQKLNITEILLARVSTSIGIEGTARAASALGYNIAFAIDATTDLVASTHDHSTKIIFPRIGEVGNTKIL